MSVRKVTTNEIQAVASILNNKAAIELLKKINENIVTEEDTKGKRKQNDIFAFVGFAHQDDVLGEDPESEDFKQKAGTLKELVDVGLVLEGAHFPLERKSEKKFGDVRVQSDERIGKYKLTEEGLAVLSVVKGSAAAEQQQQQQQQQQPTKAKSASSNKTKKAQVAEFKEEFKKEYQ